MGYSPWRSPRYVIDTYSDDEYVIARPGAVGDISELSAWLDNIATRWGIELAIDEDMIASVQPSAEGRNNLAGKVGVCAHHSSVHDGIDIEADAPTGTRITVHLNDGELADTVVPA